MATETVDRAHAAVATDDTEQASASEPADERLHLTDLRIQGFRCFEDLTINRLGRVNLIAGRNGIGKSTLLDAVRVYAERGSDSALVRILTGRDELGEEADEHIEGLGVDWSALFYGRKLENEPSICIGSSSDHSELSIKPVFRGSYEDENADQLDMGFVNRPVTHLQVSMNGHRRYVNLYPRSQYRYGAMRGERWNRDPRQRRINSDEFPDPIVCGSQGPDVTSSPELADLLDEVALTNSVQIAMELVRIVVNRRVVAAAAVGGRRRSPRPARVLVRLADFESPIPLRTLGDGAVRAFGYALALANASGGILLIDEIENGIHHAALPRFWQMLFEASLDQNVQIFVTTHSWDCIRAFADVVGQGKIENAALIRIDKTRITNRDRAVEYPVDDMIAAAKYGIEVR